MDVQMPETDEPEVLRLSIPPALQTVLALDIASGVLFLSVAVLMGLLAASWEWGFERAVLPLAVLVLYAAVWVWISVYLGRASQVARIGHVLWCALLFAWCASTWSDMGSWRDMGLMALLPAFVLVAAAVTLILLFTPAVRAFFAAVRAARAEDEAP